MELIIFIVIFFIFFVARILRKRLDEFEFLENRRLEEYYAKEKKKKGDI